MELSAHDDSCYCVDFDFDGCVLGPTINYISPFQTMWKTPAFYTHPVETGSMPGAVSLDPFIYLSFQCKMIVAKMGSLWHYGITGTQSL